jgi:hypothetical protein
VPYHERIFSIIFQESGTVRRGFFLSMPIDFSGNGSSTLYDNVPTLLKDTIKKIVIFCSSYSTEKIVKAEAIF